MRDPPPNGHLSSESCRNSIFGTGIEFCADAPPRGGVIWHIRQTLVSIRVLLVLLGLFVRFAELSSLRSQINVIK